MAAVNVTYGDVSRREDLLDIITNISPTDTPFISGLPIGTADNTLHEWLKDILEDRGDNAVAEGADPSYALSTHPSREVNYAQIIMKDFQVSDTQREVEHAGYADRYTYTMAKKMKAWKNDLEHAAILGSGASGASGTARRMKGALAFISDNATAVASGTILSETLYNSLLQLAWEDGGDIDEVYVGGWLKRKISGFTAGSTKNIEADDRRLVNVIDVYESDFGIQKVFKSRDINSTAPNTLMAIDSKLWKLAYLRKPKHVEIAKTGDNTKGMIVGEATLESLEEKGSAKYTGLSYDA